MTTRTNLDSPPEQRLAAMPAHECRTRLDIILTVLYYDDDAGAWDADKEWDGETLTAIAEALTDLRP